MSDEQYETTLAHFQGQLDVAKLDHAERKPIYKRLFDLTTAKLLEEYPVRG